MKLPPASGSGWLLGNVLQTLSCLRLRSSTFLGIWSINLHPSSQNRAQPSLPLDKPLSSCFYKEPVTGIWGSHPPPGIILSPIVEYKEAVDSSLTVRSSLTLGAFCSWRAGLPLPSSQTGLWQQGTVPHPMTHLNHTSQLPQAPRKVHYATPSIVFLGR